MENLIPGEFEEEVNATLFKILENNESLDFYFTQADNVEQLGGSRKDFEEVI